MIVGIDLGTTFSLISYINAGGVPTLIPSKRDPQRFQTASVVHVGERGAIVGDLVEELLQEEPSLPVCRFAKLGMGKSGVTAFTDHLGQAYSPEAISSLVLRKLKEDAEAALGEPVTGAVITVPANFNEAQRQATVNAGRLADIPVLGLVEEPLAAATFFGLNIKGGEKLIFVFDIGGGTLDATILSATPDGLYAIATEGADNIGGKNFDELIMGIVADQFRGQFGLDPRGEAETAQRLRMFATQSKIALSEPAASVVSKPLILAGKSLRVTFNRSQFEAAAEPWLEACQEVCERALKSQSLSWDDIDDLVLTGGSSLVPCVERKVREMSALQPARIRREQPHASIAYGAALLAEQFHGTKQTAAPPLRQQVTSNELGLRVFDPKERKAVFHAMIEKNVPVPTTARQTFYTQKADQTSLSIELLQRKDPFTPPETLGQFNFGPIRRPELNHPVTVELGYDGTGRVAVTASDGRTGESVAREFSQQAEADLTALHARLQKLSLSA
ncbi:MAG: Hsp70 family protein [Opitutaceae bacterium]|nr:Hsp70 family protein [Opitutaceae bacterium]